MNVISEIPRSWWPHVELRHQATWRGKAWLFRVVPQATLEFADRVEVYDLDSVEFEAFSGMAYNDRIAALLYRKPDTVLDKIDQLSGFASLFH